MDEIHQDIESAKKELVMLQAEIATLRAKKSVVECIRDTFVNTQPVSVLKRKVRRRGVEITISEADFQRLKDLSKSAMWIDTKITEMKRLGDKLWRELNQAEAMKMAIRRAENAELRCRCLEYELMKLRNQPLQSSDEDEGGEREIDYPKTDEWYEREL